MNTRTTLIKPNVSIFIAPQFEDQSVFGCISQLYEASIPVHIVGLLPEALFSQRGLRIFPPLTVGELELKLPLFTLPLQLLFISGGTHTAALLCADPRVHRLCETVLAQGGYIAVFREAQRVLKASGLTEKWPAAQYLAQGKMPTQRFVNMCVSAVTKQLANPQATIPPRFDRPEPNQDTV